MKKLLFTLLLIIANIANAQDFKEILSEFTNTGHAGTEFFLTFHPCWEDAGPNNRIKIFISSAYEATVNIEIPGRGLFLQKQTIPNDIIEFEFEPEEAQMYSKGSGVYPIPPLPAQAWKKRAIHIYSERPVVVYAATRFRYISDGYLALPVSLYGKNYTVSSWADPTTNVTQFLPSYTSIIAAYDGTEVKFRLGGNRSGKALLPEGDSLYFSETLTKVMDKGDVLLIPGIGAYNDLSGSTVRADKPVAVISGNFCAYIPTNASPCDYLIEMELPYEHWGTEYLVTPIIDREKNSIVKIYPKEPNTQIFLDNSFIGKLVSAGGAVGQGYLEFRAEGKARPLYISGDKPINVVQYNPGQSDDDIESDPFQMNVIPKKAFHNKLVWATPGTTKEGSGYEKNYINIVYPADSFGNIPEDLELGQMENGYEKWGKLINWPNSKTISSFNHYDENGRQWKCITIQLTQNGVYAMRGADEFAVYAYGYDIWDSYGFPVGGMFIKPSENESDSLAPEITEIENNGLNFKFRVNDIFGETWSSGIMKIIANDLGHCDFIPEEFFPGISKEAFFEINVTEPYLNPFAEITAVDFSGNETTYLFEYEAPEDEPGLNIGNNEVTNRFNIYYRPLGEAIAIINPGDFKVRLSGVRLEGDTENVELINDLKNTIINPGQQISVELKYFPMEPETIEFDLIVEHSDKPGLALKTHFVLEAVATSIGVSDVNFFQVIEKESKPGIMTVSNTSEYPIEISDIKIEDISFFTFDKDAKRQFSLQPGESQNVLFVFNPVEPGEYETTAEVISDAFSGDNKARLSGKGIINSAGEDEIQNKPGAIFSNGKLYFNNADNLVSKGIKIISLSGEIIYESGNTISLSNAGLTLPEIASGIYFAELNVEGSLLTLKFIR